jgi:TorA maturation chaperone TorD
MEKRKERSSKTNKLKVLPSLKALIEVHRFREMFYLFLSRSFSREVDTPFLQNARIILKSLKHLKEDPLVRGKQLLEDFFQKTKQTKEETILKDLAEQYASLFLGVGPENVSLCESAYLSERGLLFQDSYFEIMEEYRKVGLTKRENFHEPEDHLAVELAFMANLCRWSISTIQKGEKEGTEQSYLLQRTFLNQHLNPWVRHFTKGLLDLSPSGYYGAMAHLLKGYLEVDRNWIDELLSEIGTGEGTSSRKTKKPRGKEVKK